MSYGACASGSLSGSGSAAKRRDQDILKLMMSKYRVEMSQDEGRVQFLVEFRGPSGTSYEHGTWNVRVELPSDYPFRSPSIGFANRIFHPNVDEASGSVCLDVINQTWSPMFNLVNVFDQFLPQLLTYPNPSDPLNGEAAALLMRDAKAFDRRVREHVAKYAASASSSSASSPGAGTSAGAGPTTPELMPGSLSSVTSLDLAGSPRDKHLSKSSSSSGSETPAAGAKSSKSAASKPRDARAEEDDEDAMSVVSRDGDVHDETEDLLQDMEL